MTEGWIGVDFDGTLVEYHEYLGPGRYGLPIPLMIERVKTWLAAGQQVKIVTARAESPTEVRAIQRWCREHLGEVLEVTASKDYRMLESCGMIAHAGLNAIRGGNCESLSRIRD